jgi:hypothetical protein
VYASFRTPLEVGVSPCPWSEAWAKAFAIDKVPSNCNISIEAMTILASIDETSVITICRLIFIVCFSLAKYPFLTIYSVCFKDAFSRLTFGYPDGFLSSFIVV